RRSDREEPHAGEEEATPPQPIGPSPGADHAGGDDDRIAGEDPRQRRGGYVGEIATDVAERDVKQHRCESDHERGGGQDSEAGPPAGRDRGVGNDWAMIHKVLGMMAIILTQEPYG